MKRLSIVCAIALVTVSCASAAAWPRVVSVADLRARPLARGDWIETYDEALVSIARIMKDDLGLPEVTAALYFHRDRPAFQAALEADGYNAEAARQTASVLTAVSGHRRVLINDEGLRDAPWVVRIALLAHELTHTLQYEWAGGSRGTSDQWLREGFAEWVEVQAITRLGFTTPVQARGVAMGRIRQAGGARVFPPLSRMVTFPDWVALAQRFEQEAFYAHAWVAVEFLIERHGVDAVINYFKLFAGSDDRIGNFQRAFGQSFQEFEAAFVQSVQR